MYLRAGKYSYSFIAIKNWKSNYFVIAPLHTLLRWQKSTLMSANILNIRHFDWWNSDFPLIWWVSCKCFSNMLYFIRPSHFLAHYLIRTLAHARLMFLATNFHEGINNRNAAAWLGVCSGIFIELICRQRIGRDSEHPTSESRYTQVAPAEQMHTIRPCMHDRHKLF